MIATIVCVLVIILTSELWVPLAFVFGAIKLVTTFSLAAAWAALKSVPIWIWDFTNSALT